jgi:catechol 2,3-dioxygenase-like lactoylglutathione lyase family enzyme
MALKTLIPMLAVTDLKRTMAFYCDRLDFTVVNSLGKPDPVWCTLKRDSVQLMFNQPPDCNETTYPRSARDFQIFYFYPDDVQATHADWKAHGLPVTDLRVTHYGMREFELRDPDGYWLWFGQGTSDPPTVED